MTQTNITQALNSRYEHLKNINDYEKIEIRIENIYNQWIPFNDLIFNDFMHKKDKIHRTILNSEIILDLDDPDLETNKKNLLLCCEQLQQHNIKHYPYYTGGKGFHIHFYFENFFKYFTEEHKNMLLSLDIKKRFSIVKLSILEYLGLNIQTIDIKIIITPRKLIRAEGSLHQKGFYKSHIKDLKEIKVNKNFQLQDFFIINETPITEKMNIISPEQHDFIITKLIKEFREQEENKFKAQIRPRKLINQGIRPQIKELLQKPLLDGRKEVLFIVLRELAGTKTPEQEINKIINLWNNLNHQKGPLQENYIKLQIKDAITKDTKPLRMETIKQKLEYIKFI